MISLPIAKTYFCLRWLTFAASANFLLCFLSARGSRFLFFFGNFPRLVETFAGAPAAAPGASAAVSGIPFFSAGGACGASFFFAAFSVAIDFSMDDAPSRDNAHFRILSRASTEA